MPDKRTVTTADQVREALASWLRAFNAKDADRLMTHYDPEAVYANAAAPLMRGPDEIRPWFEAVFEELKGTCLFQEEVLFAGTDMALIAGKFHFKPADPSEGEPGETGRVGLTYRRAEDGRWLLLFDIDNMPPDALPEDFA